MLLTSGVLGWEICVRVQKAIRRKDDVRYCRVQWKVVVIYMDRQGPSQKRWRLVCQGTALLDVYIKV